MSNLLDGLYTRVELPNAMITPNDLVLLIRDYNRRLKELENKCKECNDKLKEPATDRKRTDKVSKRKVSTS